MGNSSFKSTYRFGGTVFILTVLAFSLIFGFIFKGCSSDNVINVNLSEDKIKLHDTVVVEKPIEKIVRDTVRIPVYPKPVVSPKTNIAPKSDTLSK